MLNADGSLDLGLFQINERFWCRQGGKRGGNCWTTCDKFLDDDFSDDFLCAKKIKRNTAHYFGGSGFQAWLGWVKQCQDEAHKQDLVNMCTKNSGGAFSSIFCWRRKNSATWFLPKWTLANSVQGSSRSPTSGMIVLSFRGRQRCNGWLLLLGQVVDDDANVAVLFLILLDMMMRRGAERTQENWQQAKAVEDTEDGHGREDLEERGRGYVVGAVGKAEAEECAGGSVEYWRSNERQGLFGPEAFVPGDAEEGVADV
ncbi:unnamed protein product [Cyprideis torosa]|uniref:lysozyme n=1 Tax=Cyprideis torosa TaxID=163714 RepID=A0A7R8WH42_9CRUS|nr:unnamed protein product [Cyprideis torosa]CAG0892845.1 unnamed protein product [Cyprideis torosa]